MIELNKKYALKRVKDSVSVCKRYKDKDGFKWKDMYYFSDVAQAMKKITDLAVLDGIQEGSWQAVSKKVEEISFTIDSIYEALYG